MVVGVVLVIASAIAKTIMFVMPGEADVKTTRFVMIAFALCNAFWWLPGVVGTVLSFCMRTKPMD